MKRQDKSTQRATRKRYRFIRFGRQRHEVEPVRLVMAVTVLAVISTIVIIKSADVRVNLASPQHIDLEGFSGIRPQDSAWASIYSGTPEIDSTTQVPGDFLRTVSTGREASGRRPDARKLAFIENLMPYALVALDEVAGERRFLVRLVNRLRDKKEVAEFYSAELQFDDIAEYIDVEKRNRLLRLTEKYRTTEITELLRRVNVVSPSLLLAQAAMESSWGRSRFAMEGNNYFGIWTWGENGMIPLEREDGKNHRVASYGSVLDSIRAYLLTLNRVSAYEEFRRLREETMDPLVLADGLLFYSERREEYVEDIKGMITRHRLQRFD